METIENNKFIDGNPQKKNRGGRPVGSLAYNAALRDRVISRSWSVLEEFFDDPKVKKEKKAEIASRIVVKNMPQEITGKLNFTLSELVENVHRATERNSGPMAKISDN